MVNFDNITSTGIPATEVEKINLLHKRDNVILAIEHYKTKRYLGANMNIAYAKSTLLALFMHFQATLKRHLEPSTYNTLKDLPDTSNNIDELLEGFYCISELIDKLKITRIDNTPVYDSKRIVIANRIKAGGT